MNMTDYAALGIQKKNRLGQAFCKHKNRKWFREITTSISGEPRVFLCTDCGKLCGHFFAEYEGNGFK